MADPTVGFPATDRVSTQCCLRENATAISQSSRLHHPIVHNTRNHTNSSSQFYPAPFLQQPNIHRQVRPSPPQLAYSQRASVAPFYSHNPQRLQYAVKRHFTTKDISDVCRAKGQDVAVDGGKESTLDLLLAEKKAALFLEFHRMRKKSEVYARLDSMPTFGPKNREGASGGQFPDPVLLNGLPCSVITTNPGNTSYTPHGLPKADRHVSHELLLRDWAKLSRGMPSSSMHVPSRTEPGTRDLSHFDEHQLDIRTSKPPASPSVDRCGGYAVDHDSLPRIVAVHSAGIQNNVSQLMLFSSQIFC